jgi:hypothetical protein
MNLSKVSHLPLAAFLAAVIMVGMPAMARLHPKPKDDPWLKLRPPLYPVAGTLRFEGRPVVGAVVTFVAAQPDGDREYVAVSATDKDGRFWLRTFSSQGDGAVAGSHFIKVEKSVPTGRMVAGPGMESLLHIGSLPPWIDALDAATEQPLDPMMTDPQMFFPAFAGMPETVNILPARFADEKTSGLSAEVTREGPNEFLIELHQDPPPEDEPESEPGEQSVDENGADPIPRAVTEGPSAACEPKVRQKLPRGGADRAAPRGSG